MTIKLNLEELHKDLNVSTDWPMVILKGQLGDEVCISLSPVRGEYLAFGIESPQGNVEVSFVDIKALPDLIKVLQAIDATVNAANELVGAL